MEYCSKVLVSNNLKNRINIWLEYKSNKKRSNKWIIKYDIVDEDNSLCFMIYSTDNYSNSGNLTKSICSYVFGSKQRNISPDGFNYLVETFQLSCDLDFYKKIMKYFLASPIPEIYNPNIFDNITFFKYSKKRVYTTLITQQHINDTKNEADSQLDNELNNESSSDSENDSDNEKQKKLNLQCSFCIKSFSYSSSAKRHEKKCINNPDRSILKIKELEITNLKNELEKTKQLLDLKKYESIPSKTTETINTSTNIVNGNITNIINTINVTNNIVLNNNMSKMEKLNFYCKDTIDFDTFLDKYQNDPKYKLTFEETKILLENSEMNGYRSFINDLSFYLKKKYKLQFEDFSNNTDKICTSDASILPFINNDVNYRTHYEKFLEEWKVCSMDAKIKKLIAISNNHIYEHHNKLVLLCNRENKSVVNGLLKNSSFEIVDNYLTKLQDCLEQSKLENNLKNSLPLPLPLPLPLEMSSNDVNSITITETTKLKKNKNK